MTIDEADYDPGTDELLHDSKGNAIDSDYVDNVSCEAEIGYALDDLAPVRIGRPSLSEAGDSPQVRFRLPAATRAVSGGAHRSRRKDPLPARA